LKSSPTKALTNGGRDKRLPAEKRRLTEWAIRYAGRGERTPLEFAIAEGTIMNNSDSVENSEQNEPSLPPHLYPSTPIKINTPIMKVHWYNYNEPVRIILADSPYVRGAKVAVKQIIDSIAQLGSGLPLRSRQPLPFPLPSIRESSPTPSQEWTIPELGIVYKLDDIPGVPIKSYTTMDLPRLVEDWECSEWCYIGIHPIPLKY
jgi:hypothetical protein